MIFGGAALVASRVIAAGPEALSFTEFYKSFGVLGYEFSDRVKSLGGKRVVVRGYMAPPLKPESPFFVLTREPLAICPFCDSDASWPSDILVIYLARASAMVSADVRLAVEGQLEIGAWTDPESGFVSQLRLRDASFRKA
jgi:hypothetical protein